MSTRTSEMLISKEPFVARTMGASILPRFAPPSLKQLTLKLTRSHWSLGMALNNLVIFSVPAQG